MGRFPKSCGGPGSPKSFRHGIPFWYRFSLTDMLVSKGIPSQSYRSLRSVKCETFHTYALLVGDLEHFLFSHILGIIIPIDFHIFQRVSNHQFASWWITRHPPENPTRGVRSKRPATEASPRSWAMARWCALAHGRRWGRYG